MDEETQNAADNETRETVKVPCAVYSRVVGYMTPVGSWNTGKQQEFSERVTYDKAIPES